MLNDKSMKNIFKNLAKTILLLFFVSIGYMGCGDDELTSGPPVVDTTAINYNNLIINERTSPFDSAFSSVDLYHGTIVQEQSTFKDAVLVDSGGASTVFYFRSGDLSLLDMPLGFQTNFKTIFEYPNITQAQFDTLTVIPDSDTTLTPSDFTLDQTSSFGDPLSSHPVFGFYLAGRYPTYSSNQVYGMIYLDSAWRDNGVYKLKFDVKINKNGENRFLKNSNITD
ncbi:MAG: hypothetical protein EHM58_13350 [Ignavibacteriae bacterium]|nr:MAG: hypothetical protein EHM58_13350 [Ignavibacteriota bacterium]